MAHAKTHSLVPALGFHSLTRFYDLFIGLTLREKALKGRLVDEARVAPGHEVLDVGCGTGTLALLVKAREPGARVTGLDADPAVLELARRKVAKAGVEVTLKQGLADAGDSFAKASFDRILTSFVLHHLTTDQKLAAFAAMRSWLRPGGSVHVLDFGPAGHSPFGLVSRVFAGIHGDGTRLGDNLEGRLPDLMRAAGFASARETGRAFTPFGSASYYEARP